MPWQNDNGGRGDPRSSGATPPGSDLEDLIRQGQDGLKQIMPSGSPRGVIFLAILALAGLGAWTAYYTVPSDSVAVVQRFGKYLKNVPPGLHFKLPLGIDAATFAEHLHKRGARGLPNLATGIRFVTYRGITRKDVERAATIIRQTVAARPWAA